MTFDQMSETERAQTIAAENRKLNADKKEPTAFLQTFSDIKPEALIWLWEGRIAMGKLTIYAGDPGLGKSQGTLDLAARLSTGREFPDGSPCKTGDTIILTSEDDPGDTIRPRLDAAGAEVSRVHIIKGQRTADGNIKPIYSLKNYSVFMDAIYQIREKGHDFCLLIIDPLDSFLDGGDSNSNEQVREALDSICALAEKEKFAIVGIKHFNKGGGNAAYRVGGSIAFTAKARSVWVFTEDGANNRSLFLPLKNNLGAGGGGFQYSIQVKDTGGIIAPFISWEGLADDNIQDVLNQPHGGDKAPEQESILQLLNESGVVMKTGDIAAALGKRIGAISMALSRLKDKGKVSSPSHGQWGIPGLSHVQNANSHIHASQGGVDTREFANETAGGSEKPVIDELEIY